MLTLERLQDLVFDVLGRAPSSTNAIELLVNEAGIAWCNAHDWGYLRRRKLEVPLVDGQGAYALGTDVVTVESVIDPSIPGWAPELLPRPEFEELRAYESTVVSAWWNGTIYDDTVGGLAQKVLEIHPTPTSARTLVLIYRGTWRPVDKRGVALDIPVQLEPAFVEWIMSWAEAREKRLPRLEALKRAKENPVVQDAMSREGRESRAISPRPGPVGRNFADQQILRGSPGRTFQDDWYGGYLR